MGNVVAQEASGGLVGQDLGTLLHKALDRYWDLVAYSTHAGEHMYYRDIAASVIQLHELLRQAGIAPGDKVALLGRNSPHVFS